MTLSRREIQECVNDDEWQLFRLSLKGLSTIEKLYRLRCYAQEEGLLREEERRREVRVENYLNALKRGGQIKW
jgi:hypothetical protein